MPNLPPFPVDDVTLANVEHSLGAAYDGDHNIVGAEFNLLGLLHFLSGSPQAAPTEDPDIFDGGTIYHPHDVIKALIREVRRLRDAQGTQEDQ